jgi:myo-inositol-1(or 4)-monophosphatase
VPPTAADDLDLLKTAGAAGAVLALAYFRRDQKIWTKDGGSPVSEADIAVDKRLAEILRTARPDYGWLSEETTDNPERLDRTRVFVVDPIDGTRGFIAGRNEWTISLAVVEGGRPVAAVLMVPALSVSFWAVAGGGACRDGERLEVGADKDLASPRFASPRRYASAFEKETATAVRHRVVPSLAYRIALVAANEIDVAIAKPNARDWDLAAADLLVQEAGARLADLSGQALRYNGTETAHPTLIATTPALFGRVADMVRDVDGQGHAQGPGNQDGEDGRRPGEPRTATASPGLWRGT